ncbi:hypothetical protein O9K51_10389 [Purpureocillium lavendulum]|uniref:Uncharacterized protein n=1 Tax=Purpureocillium lavendulum TaxID=1247861 RepID=A0AB34FDZ2_9HYPO|nr:hypothetical protein O9K51_10389 [Purpureocillium lavendulum]
MWFHLAVGVHAQFAGIVPPLELGGKAALHQLRSPRSLVTGPEPKFRNHDPLDLAEIMSIRDLQAMEVFQIGVVIKPETITVWIHVECHGAETEVLHSSVLAEGVHARLLANMESHWIRAPLECIIFLASRAVVLLTPYGISGGQFQAVKLCGITRFSFGFGGAGRRTSPRPSDVVSVTKLYNSWRRPC